MNEKLKIILKSAEDKMQSSLTHLENELLNIRAGKANPNMLKSVMVDYYGNPTAIGQLANINTPDSKSLIVQPWDKSLLREIEKGIINANLGFNPMNNGDTVIVSIPPLTEERRKELVKIVRNESENSKIGIRNIRKDSNQEIKKTDISDDEKKNFEIDIQELTDNFITKIDSVLIVKEKEIMTI
ncbi:MAG: ribosome recycling factor [Flavobacteriaceae bacterium TMED206]|mgnify:FL=1|nr:MAG: ribosome recycling factor [Flavobacteriaceae bacterium TMED206]